VRRRGNSGASVGTEVWLNHFGERKGTALWDRFTVHYTPKHGSWLNQAELEISLLSRQCLGSRRIPDWAKLRRETQAWNRTANQKRTKINWVWLL